MQFPIVFSRFKTVVPAGKIAIGADTNPPTNPPSPKGADNEYSARYRDMQGWPVHRIAVLYKAPSGATMVTGTLYMYEKKTSTWYRIGPVTNITPGVVAFFDMVSLIDEASPSGAPAGAADLKLIILDPNGVADGEHIFAIGADLTTIGY